MRSHQWITAPRRADRERLLAGLDLPPLLAQVSAHRRLRGPYTATGTLLRAVAPAALKLRPALGPRHRIELQETTPELAGLVPPAGRPLARDDADDADDAGSRCPARLHSLRICHGIVDFLAAHLDDLAAGPRALVVDDAHHADPTDREFLAVLLRRIRPERLTVVVMSAADLPPDPPGPVSESLAHALDTYTVHVTAVPEGPAALPGAGDEALARVYVDSDGTDDDPAKAAAYARLDDRTRQALHDARAAVLERAAEAEPSLRLGALPYHLERGGDPVGAGVAALRRAQVRCQHLGLHQSAVGYGERGLRLVDAGRDPDTWWEFTRDTAAALAAAGRGEESGALQDAARRTSTDPLVHMKLAYETGMLYARHHAPGRLDPDRARAWINQAVAIAGLLEDPGERAYFSVFNRSGLALVETRAGRADEALRLLDEGIARLDRKAGPGERARHRTALLRDRAQVNTVSGRLEEALADYALVLAVEDDVSDHYVHRGAILRRLGRTREALTDWEEALRLEPPFPEAYYHCGDARLELGDVHGALADFERTLELDPGHVDALLNRAAILADLGEDEEAMRSAAAGLAIEPEHARLLCLKGRLLAEDGSPGPALEALGAALRSDPGLAQAYAVRAALAFEAGDLPTATADFDRALELGDFPEIRFNRGLVHEAAGRYAQAAADFEAVLGDLDDDETRARYNACLRAVEHV